MSYITIIHNIYVHTWMHIQTHLSTFIYTSRLIHFCFVPHRFFFHLSLNNNYTFVLINLNEILYINTNISQNHFINTVCLQISLIYDTINFYLSKINQSNVLFATQTANNFNPTNEIMM